MGQAKCTHPGKLCHCIPVPGATGLKSSEGYHNVWQIAPENDGIRGARRGSWASFCDAGLIQFLDAKAAYKTQ